MSDQTRKPASEQLLKLSDDVNRIAAALARISTEDSGGPKTTEPSARAVHVSIKAVRSALRARRLRMRYFSPDLFADPVWDMLLTLFLAELTQQRMATRTLCDSAGVPATTALRWLNNLVEKKLLVRRDDPLDARRRFVELAPAASDALRQYFRDLA